MLEVCVVQVNHISIPVDGALSATSGRLIKLRDMYCVVRFKINNQF